MAEQVTIPEAPDGTILYWPASAEDEAPVVMARVTPDPANPDARWVVAILREDPVTYDEASAMGDRYGYPMSEAVHLVPSPEMVGDHPREPAGYCRRCGEVHSEPEWQRIADRAAEGGSSDG